MMKKGGNIHGFEILDTPELGELKARGIWARHRSGAEVFHVLNDDPENLFSFAFATAPEDSAGAAHILEHSVLCGSERYPLKDAFLVLAQGSLQTFLNAWTFPDKTVYPASSVNEKDYFNLMAVYADAVFRPLLSEWTFMQEGWRLVPGKTGLEYTGVVYNEMKGAYSSMDTYAGLWSVKGIMPGTPYAFESGGDPDDIPSLSWEALKEFHRTRYAPGNCKIFLAGNIDTKKQFDFLDRCLAGLPPGRAAPPVPVTERWQEPKKFRIPCPGSGQEKNKNQALLSWLCSGSTDPGETTALACLAEILLGHDGSPLTRALIESGIGEDLSPVTGLEGELRETVFSAGLRGIQKNGGPETAYRRMEDLILGELRRLVKEGIPKEEIDAALLSIEFSHREIKRSQGPYSLVWMRRALRGWLYGQRPWESLLFVPEFTKLKERLKSEEDGVYTRCFESLIEKYLLNNPHHALIILEGEEDYLPQKEAARSRELAEKERSLSKTEKKLLAEKAANLEKIQREGESRAALETIPHLSRHDLVPKIEQVPSELGFLSAADIPCMVHPLFTNGISYADLAFPVDVLPPEDYPWLPFFTRAVVSLGLPGMDYGEVSGLLARTAGGFHALLETGSGAAPGDPPVPPDPADLPASLKARDWIIYRIKALDEKFGGSLDLAKRLIAEADFSDLRRLRDLAVEMKNDGDSSLAASGHSYASGRSGKFFSRSRAVEELWNGLDQISFAHTLAAMDLGELRDRMLSIRNALLKAGLAVNITASPEALAGARRGAEIFGALGAPRPPHPRCREKEEFFSLLAQNQDPAPEVYASPSLQIGFAAMSLPAVPYGSPEEAAELALSHELSTGALWESIRMMGGAYGAFAHPDNLEGVFSLATYRDPDPLRSLGAFPGILKKRAAGTIDDDTLEKIIIGAFARETRPRTPADKGFSEFLRRLYGIRESHRLSRLKALVGLKAEETGAAARRLAKAAERTAAAEVVITGPRQAEKAAKKLGTGVKTLPV
ncbi:MAG: insulinase family protein [Treponema sp.]|jgi:Zn-dependent M16 (insulinase) family peptidase|nr:insulinase family protein [Treponema sp.]